MPKQYVPPEKISIEFDGKTYTGSYQREHAGITVRSDHDGGESKFAVLHNSPAELLAKIMLREIIESSQSHSKNRSS